MFLERDEMKFAILYTLSWNIEPMNMACMCEILTWDKEVMGYFDLAIMLRELIDDGYVIKNFYKNEESFTLTQRGLDTNDFFSKRVPGSVRKKIEDAIGFRKFNDQIDPNAINTEIIPISNDRYMSELQMLENNSPLLELRVDAGNRSSAETIAARMKVKSAEIYKEIMKILDETDRT
ncbi:MAG: DUF4364 family protein [Oscillospiraceae bacterium]